MRKLILAVILVASVGPGLSADEQSTDREPTQSGLTRSSNNALTTAQRIIVDPNLQEMVDSMARGAVSNGLACAVQFDRSLGPTLGFYVNIINATTNYVLGFIRMPFDGFANIELLDSDEKPVEKTDAGKKVGWTVEQVKDYYHQLRRKRAEDLAKYGSVSGATATPLIPLWPLVVSERIRFHDLFHLKAAGEYSFHLRMCVAQNRADGKGEVTLHVYWLPEVVAKVRILPQDLPVLISPTNMQTNPASK